MTTSPGWEPRPGPTRGDTARRSRPAVAGGWPAQAPDGRRNAGPVGQSRDPGQPSRDPGQPNRDGYDSRRPERLGPPADDPRQPRFTGSPPPAPHGAGPAGPRTYGRPRPGGGAPAGHPARDPRDRLGRLRSRPLLGWLGALSTRNALLALVAATMLGIVSTLLVGREPGFLIGLFITIGSVAATLGIRRGAVYLMFPLPAFACFVAAVITGKIHDSRLTSSTLGTGVGFLQWIAEVFVPMVIATIAVLVVGGIRWLLDRQLVIGQFPVSAGRASASPGPPPAAGPRPDAARPDRLPPDRLPPDRSPRGQRPDRDRAQRPPVRPQGPRDPRDYR